MNDNNSDFRTVRGYQLENLREGKLTPALEDYMEMVFRLCAERGYARVGQLSELLNVKPPSVSKMIHKLAALGYLKYERYEIIRLTESGRAIGEYLLLRHNVIESFLALIGSKNALEETELIEHSLSSATVAALSALRDTLLREPELLRRISAPDIGKNGE